MNTKYLLACCLLAICSTAAAQNGSTGETNSPAEEAFIEPAKTIQVASAEMGIIDQVHVKIGEAVNAGQLLFELDQDVLIASKKIAEAKANSTARLKAAQIAFENKDVRLKRVEGLAQNSAASPEEVSRAHSEVLIAQQEIDAIREELEQNKLEIKRLEAQIESRRIKSPIDGIVVDLKKQQGEHVSTSDPVLVTIVELDTLRAIFHLPNSIATKLTRGDSISLYLSETNQEAAAIVEFVSPITRADSGRVRVDVEIANPQGNFRSGLRCRIVQGTQRNASLVPIQR